MIEIAELRRDCRITGTAHDDRLMSLERAAVEVVEKAHGRYYGTKETRTEWLKGTGRRDLYLPDPLSKGSTLTTLDEIAYPGATANTITASAANGFEVRDRVVLVRKGGNVWKRGYEYKVTWDRGFDDDQPPADVRELVSKLVVWWFERGVPAPKAGEVFGANSELPFHLNALLRQNKRLRC